MCIIAYSPENTPIPSESRRAQMFKSNPDGAGFMYPVVYRYTRNGVPCVYMTVRIEKGFMSFDAMERRLAELAREIDLTAAPIVFHYRIGTHGGNTAGNTHPFPVTAKRRELKRTKLETPIGVAHNGIIHCVNPQAGYSDTQEYIATRLCKMPMPLTKTARKKIAKETASKLAVMYDDGRVDLIGQFIKDEDGCFYSNDSYIKPRYTYRFNFDDWYSQTYSGKTYADAYLAYMQTLEDDYAYAMQDDDCPPFLYEEQQDYWELEKLGLLDPSENRLPWE